MKVIRIFYYIFFTIFILLFSVTFFAERFFGHSESQLKKMFPDPEFPVTHHTYTQDGLELDYYAIGPDTAQRIIFLHGSPGSWDNFAVLMAHPELYQTHRLIAVNRAGYGIASSPGIASLDQQVGFILPLIQNSVSGKKPVLVGHSMGGPIVIRAAMNYSNRLNGVISLAGSLDGDLEPNEWFRGLYHVFPINLFMSTSFKASNDELFVHFKELNEMKPDWKKITCPVYIFQGTSDNLVNPKNADFAEIQLRHLEEQKIIRIPGEDHFIPWTKDDEIYPYILEIADSKN